MSRKEARYIVAVLDHAHDPAVQDRSYFDLQQGFRFSTALCVVVPRTLA